MKRARLKLSRLSVGQKLAQGGTIKTAMTGNPRFTNPTISLSAYGTILDDLSAKQTAYEVLLARLKAALDERGLAEAAYDSATTRLASYVEDVTGGDSEAILSAGMDVRDPSLPIGALAQVGNLQAEACADSGQLRLRWQPLRGAHVYEVQISDNISAEPSWKTVEPSCNTRTKLTGLTSGVKMRVRVRGIGKRGPGPWSQSAERTVP